ncbi:MAG: zinc ABC transporter substrate-binding protein [Bacilli bacterium]|nr:zinc ABC transporter substrate-binding protein [Bacilli bacterium]
MKRFKSLFIGIILLGLTGCLKNDSMEDINIVTSSYPIEFVVNELYGGHSTITSLYPKDDEIIDFKVTDVLLEQYSNNDLFIFNGLSEEKNYVNKMVENNDKLMIIDVTSNITGENIHSIEELWLDPNNLLTMANNIRKGFKEYINSTYLTDEVDENYENLKINLTGLDGKYYSTIKDATNKTIIVSDDAFLFLENYGIDVISLDPDTRKDKDVSDAKKLLKDESCNYVFVKYKEDNEKIKEFLEDTGADKLELYTMTNLEGVNVDKNNYITLMNQNLENLKLELYK